MDILVLKTGLIQVPVDIVRDGAVVPQKDASGNPVQIVLSAPVELLDENGVRVPLVTACDRANGEIVKAFQTLLRRVSEESPADPPVDPPLD